jgi:cholesterol oxidase
MQRLSLPPDQMHGHYSAVVVGSGYGGAIVASRIARTGRDVCVLERGRELHPGEYPNSALTGLRETQIHTPAADRGPATGMFEFHAGRDVTVLVGCGLGGTSLINANVVLEPGDSIFADDRWPAELRDHPEVLKPFMQTAKAMFGSNPYPHDWPELPKLAALERAAEGLRRSPGGATATVTRPEINVTFTAGRNAAGIQQEACVLCGDCCSGCNYGAKNTLLMNYLPDAHAHGAHIFTEVAVRSVRRWQGKWQVIFDTRGEGRDRHDGAPAQFVTADVVVLAAGTLGSTKILLRSRTSGLPLSDRLGYGFSGNGDALAFAYDTDSPVQGVGLGRRRPADDTVVGPAIAGLIDLRHPGASRQDALIIQEGAIPGALAAMLPVAMYATSRENPGGGPLPQARRLRQFAGIPLGSYRGSIDRTLTYLITGTDDSGGRILLEDDRVRVEWPEAGGASAFVRDGHISAATEALRGTPVPDPLWTAATGQSPITVHPLGGCVMADDETTGVVDHKGQVFDPQSGGVHEGLYVCDGSVIPVALAANPLLTISAIAERTADILIRDRKWEASQPDRPAGLDQPGGDATVPAAAADAPPTSPRARLSFTERMTGFVSMRVGGDFREGHACGRDDGGLVEVLLTIDYDDIQAVLNDPTRPAAIVGTVLAPELSPHRMTVTQGHFTLLDPDPSQPQTWQMRYWMSLLAEDGKRYVFDGHKVIRKRGARHAWSETTTLYTTIRELDGPALTEIRRGTGILRLQASDLARMLRTMNVRGAPARKQREYRLAFGALFAGELARIYGGALNVARAFPRETGRAPSAVREPRHPDGTWWYDEPGGWHANERPGDDAFVRLIRYNCGPKGPVMLATGFGMSTRSFLAPTVEVNITEFLAEAGYDVWLFDYRAGIDLPSSRTSFTIDDIARCDWPLAVAKVLELTGRDDVQAFGHCVGSLSLQMAVLAGLTGIRSAVCAQAPLHPVTSAFNQVKSGLHVAEALEGIGLRTVAPTIIPSLPNALLDTLLRALPMPAEEECGQAVCRWINAIYGCTHHHARLNDATHSALNEMFGVGNLEALRHLALMMRTGAAVTRSGGRDYFEHPERFANTKLLLLQGQHNYIFHPDGTLRTLRWLREHNRQGHYERIVLPHYAHLDAIVGARAAVDVYPQIVDFFDRT